MKKLVLPAVLLVVFFFALLMRSPYAAAFIGGAGYYASAALNGIYGLYSWFINLLRPGAANMTPVADAFFAIVLLCGGYLLSSAFIFVHRHNKSLYYRGRKMYAAVFAFMAAVFVVVNGKYMLLDPIVTLIVSLVMGYLLTSFVWGAYDVLRERKIVKKTKKQKTLAKYFRWEFKYLK